MRIHRLRRRQKVVGLLGPIGAVYPVSRIKEQTLLIQLPPTLLPLPGGGKVLLPINQREPESNLQTLWKMRMPTQIHGTRLTTIEPLMVSPMLPIL